MASACAGWQLYFPDEPFDDGFPYLDRIDRLKQYFADVGRPAGLKDGCTMTTLSVNVDYQALATAADFAESTPSAGDSIGDDIREQPSIVLKCMGLAMYQVLHEAEFAERRGTQLISAPPTIPIVTPRLQNFEPITQLKHLKANYIGKFISIRGTVVRVGNVKPLVTKMLFRCQRCGEEQVLSLPDGKYYPPTRCPADDCRSKSFAAGRSSPATQTIDFQQIRIQEIIETGLHESGRIPRTLECELTGDLVDSCVPGDIAVVNGEVKVVSTDEGGSKSKKKDQAMFLLYLFVNSVSGPRTKTAQESAPDGGSQQDSSNDMIEFSLKDLYAIQLIQQERDVFKTIVNSLCPAIYGHELVKAGLLLGLFGGRQKYINDKNRIPVRGDPHILVVGDPGLGKSQMLHAVASVCPRGVYVCGNTTTTAGLTVTLHKDGGSGDYALEAGALVLADQGCCCIDEFDKMGAQHNALLEAMEQQSISLAKAGVVCSLPARTSIIAAANPVGGHYNKGRTVAENLKMGAALLSRFDLVFILLDKADESMDRLLSAHVMALHSEGGSRLARARAFASSQAVLGIPESGEAFAVDAGPDDADYQAWLADKPLEQRLKITAGDEGFEPIPAKILRKYIGYARKYVQPVLEPSAAAVLQQFYLDLRQKHRDADSTPITTRQIESLVRLAEARARLELREVVTQQDAEEVVEIMKCSMVDTYSDEFGQLDFQRSQHGSGMSKKAQAKRYISELHRIAEETYNSMFTLQQLRTLCNKMNLQVGSFMEFIGSLNNQGFLLQKGAKTYQLATSAY